MRRVWMAGSLLPILLAGLPARAQMRAPLDELLLADARREQMVYSGGQKVWVLLSQRPVEQVLLQYLAISRQPQWKLTFPSQTEALSWLEALKKTGESKVFMLNLYHPKTKVNYVLTLGPVSGTSKISARSIITIYSMQRPFGR